MTQVLVLSLSQVLFDNLSLRYHCIYFFPRLYLCVFIVSTLVQEAVVTDQLLCARYSAQCWAVETHKQSFFSIHLHNINEPYFFQKEKERVIPSQEGS